MNIKADEITKIIQQEIEGYEPSVDIREVGTVTSVGDGIARIYGLDRVMYNELLEFPRGVFGMALNLEEDRCRRRPPGRKPPRSGRATRSSGPAGSCTCRSARP